MQHYIKQCETFGRGLYATHDLQPGQIIFSAELLVLSAEGTLKLQATELRDYVFTYNATQDCLVLGDGELFNHSDSNNVGFKLGKHGERTVMYFYALQPIEANQQLFINYADDLRHGETLAQYEKNLIGA
jgi:hypothetical protein